MKFMGAGIIWICLALWGVTVFLRYKERYRLLTEVCDFLKGIKLELEYTSDSVYALLLKMSDSCRCSHLSFLRQCCKALEDGEAFPTAWKKSLSQSGLPFFGEEREKLESFCDFFGVYEKNQQLQALELLQREFEGFALSGRTHLEKRGKNSVLLGCLFGMGAFIMIV